MLNQRGPPATIGPRINKAPTGSGGTLKDSIENYVGAFDHSHGKSDGKNYFCTALTPVLPHPAKPAIMPASIRWFARGKRC